MDADVEKGKQRFNGVTTCCWCGWKSEEFLTKQKKTTTVNLKIPLIECFGEEVHTPKYITLQPPASLRSCQMEATHSDHGQESTSLCLSRKKAIFFVLVPSVCTSLCLCQRRVLCNIVPREKLSC